MGMAGFEIDVVAHASGGGDGEQPDRAAADHHDPLAVLDVGTTHAVPRHAARFDEAGVGEVESLRQRDEAALRHPGTVGEPAVDEDAEVDVVAGAPVGVSGPAFVAHTAVRVGLHGIRHAVDGAGELVPEREVLRPHGHEAEVGAADARRHDLHEHALAGRLIHLDHGGTLLRAADPPHGEAVCQP
jgi:hypothetical protein